MQWIKYRHKYSYGVSKWEYLDLGNTTIDDFLEENYYRHYHEDHCRGIEYEVIDMPPQEYLETLQRMIKSEIGRLEERLADISTMLFIYYLEEYQSGENTGEKK